jgi:hypothetical protein
MKTSAIVLGPMLLDGSEPDFLDRVRRYNKRVTKQNKRARWWRLWLRVLGE